jgi:hypothetical protein
LSTIHATAQRASTACAVTAIALASVISPASSADPATAQAGACTTFTTVATVQPTNTQGRVDRSVTLGLQRRRCTYGDDNVWHYRVTVTNHYASGKTDVAVALKHADSCIGYDTCSPWVAAAKVDGVWHPRVNAGSTWASPYYVERRTATPTTTGWWAFGEIHVSYRGAMGCGRTTADYCGRTATNLVPS